MLEDECHTLDLLIAEDQARHGGIAEEGLYAMYVNDMKNVQKIENKIATKRDLLDHYSENATLGQLAQQSGYTKLLKKKIEQLVSDVIHCS